MPQAASTHPTVSLFNRRLVPQGEYAVKRGIPFGKVPDAALLQPELFLRSSGKRIDQAIENSHPLLSSACDDKVSLLIVGNLYDFTLLKMKVVCLAGIQKLNGISDGEMVHLPQAPGFLILINEINHALNVLL
jgi:hypothetical protein